ncbi:metallophosphoesterase family protein [Paenibacillus aurantiacus]|uniref:Metallophosphoesterase family protein n=1 Tax=Paenibacillus aurantiacus TaxID=1936118 RepID=A0ABV5KY97_9BACL
MQITDLHWTILNEENRKAHQLMENVLKAEEPDLVIFTGDIIHVENCMSPVDSFLQATKAVRDSGIPWSIVFGNHDALDETAYISLLNAQLDSITCLTEQGPRDIHGFSNYSLPIYANDSDQIGAAVICLDSGSYAPSEIGGADWIKADQIQWFREECSRIKQYASSPTLPPTLAFFHIPLPEYLHMWTNQVCYGDKFENVGSSKVNSGLFAAMLQEENVIGVFVGHDHVNDFQGKLYGIRLCYGRLTGYNSYGKEGMLKGVRMIQLRENASSFDSWIRLEDGSIITLQDEHRPE